MVKTAALREILTVLVLLLLATPIAAAEKKDKDAQVPMPNIATKCVRNRESHSTRKDMECECKKKWQYGADELRREPCDSCRPLLGACDEGYSANNCGC